MSEDSEGDKSSSKATWEGGGLLGKRRASLCTEAMRDQIIWAKTYDTNCCYWVFRGVKTEFN